MADSHPYISGPGNIAQMVNHLRKNFPTTVTSATVKKLSLASNNESYLINALQFIGLLDEEGKKTSEASKVFSHHKDEDFTKAFADLVKKAYTALFDLHGDGSWDLDTDGLIAFFRQTDQTSDAIGRRQAATFKVFAALAGHAELPKMKGVTKAPEKKTATPKQKKTSVKASEKPPVQDPPTGGKTKDVGLTVRIEINLPDNGTKETYDAIFKSIKENLIDE